MKIPKFATMNFSSKLVENAVNQLSSLPGIGKKSALRLVLHMIKQEKQNINQFGNSFIDLINNINYCSECFSISDNQKCEICSDQKRDKSTICVVEDIRVMMAVESTMQFKGIYHVLGGLISPMDGIGPSDIKVEELIQKVQNSEVKEIIFALSTTMEGDTTTFYIHKQLSGFDVLISTIARGIPVGDELEYADEITLGRSILKRIPYEDSLQG